ncbi:MAG: hypothetical protein LBH20_10435 [Treponema sp.]|jgi:hypothetical protein|nr:hypothetical protein [Treponema sp.]
MGKRAITLALLGMAGIMAVQAAGRKDNESHEADNPEGFTSSINIENKKPGKYNFYIEAKDQAGNRTLAGPDNIYNDPESDLPIAHIINPRVNMHVQGNLNIVGSCIDDDGVDHVEFVVTRGANGKGEELVRTRAEGKEFWSYYLETTNKEIWTDGVYTLTAWGVDINGLSGVSDTFPAKSRKFHQVTWHLDRKKPETKVTSHEIGALVTGKVRLKGTVYDGNGVKYLRYSLDEGVRYQSVPLKYDRRRDVYNWELTIDTKVFEDGPAVVWFQAQDGMNTAGMAAHLLFVNNTSPEVKILYPQPDSVVSGMFTASGYAAHPVGLKSVSWKLGKKSGEIPLVIGNSWWIQEFDVRTLKASGIDLEIRAEDLSGNVTVVKQKLKVDPLVGQPRVTLETPAANTVLNGAELTVRGTAVDNEAVASVLYSINSQAAVEIPCNGYFQFAVPGLPAGNHVLDVWAKDITGIEGPKVQVKGITVIGPLPEPRIASIRGGAGRSSAAKGFFTGMEISIEPKMLMDFTVKSANPLTGASISFGGQPAIPVNVKIAKDGLYHADVPVPLNLGSGLVKMELRASDRSGRESVYEEFMFTGSSGAGDVDFQWIRPAINPDNGRIMITGAEEALLGLGKVPLQDASLRGSGADNLLASVDEYGRVLLQARRQGSFGPLTLNLSGKNGENLVSSPFSVFADFSDPAIELEAGTDGRWVQNDVQIKGSVSDANDVTSLEFTMDLGDSWQPMSRTGMAFEQALDVSAFPDGTIMIQIRAVDEAGRIAIKNFILQKDTQAPQAQLIVPIEEARVNGAIRLGIEVKEAGSIRRVTYRRPASGENRAITKVVYPYPDAYDENGEKINRWPSRFLDILTDPIEMPLDDKMSIVIEDAAGNQTTINSWPFVIDNEMDIPVAHIILPLEDEVIIADFEVSGICYDDDAIRAVFWRIDNKPEQKLETGNGFSISLALSSLTDNEHSITVIPEDIYGVRGKPITRKFRVSLSEPVASVSTPSFDMISGGMVEMSGGAFDENGIGKVQISVDNGNTFNDARINAYGSTAEWFYDINSKILKDGAHVIFIRVTDKYNIPALYSGLLNIDNTPPEITLDSPPNGMITTGPISILGQVADMNLESKSIALRSLGGQPVPPGFSIYRANPSAILKESMDISALRDGFYNIEVQITDKANNVTIISRNIELARESLRNFVNILYPLNGEHIQGIFNLYGSTGGIDKAQTVTLKVNNADLMTADVTWTGYYCFSLNEEHLTPGWNTLVVHSDFGGADKVISETRSLYYQPDGPWVTIDSLTMGDFAFERPWFSGRAGYRLNAEEEALLADKTTGKDIKAQLADKTLDNIELSFDNGGTFIKTSKSKDKDNEPGWRYRLETGEMVEGMHYIIVRANMKNGESAVTRTLVQVDKTPPHIRLIAPQAGGHYNMDLEFAAMASDDVALASISYHLRAGDKMFYEVPGFIQGLYFDVTIPPFIRQITNKAPAIFAGGVTYMDFGLGLSFFDDNVKIEAQYGFMTQSLYESLGGDRQLRYGGHVLGLKLLANVYTLPFGSFAGPDWEWLSASIALGANFSLFDLGHEGLTQSGASTWMSALLAQIEFPKVTIPKRTRLRTFSLFTEGQLWFVPTDVDYKAYGINIVIPHVIVGLRLYAF